MRLRDTVVGVVVGVSLGLVIGGLVRGVEHTKRLLTTDELVRDVSTNILWQRRAPFEMVNNPSAARDYCEKIEIGGAKGWRLPSADELEAGFPFTPRALHWSSTPVEGVEGAVLAVDLSSGAVKVIRVPNSPVYLRCVKPFEG